VPENLIGMGEQEPNPVDRDGNKDGRKDETGEAFLRHQRTMRDLVKPQRDPCLNLTGQGY
jgi:hypothetical protein